MIMYGIIYVLIDPRDSAVRYVGQTVDTLRSRVRKHISSARPGSHLGYWLAQLVREGHRPVSIPIAIAQSKQELDELEIAFIREMRLAGAALTNYMAGGSPHSTEEWRARKSAQMTGKSRPPEVVAKTSGENHWAYREDVNDADILARLAAGEQPVEIAEAIKVTATTVRKRARVAGWTAEWPSDEESAPADRIRELLAEGKNGVEIAEALGVSTALISRNMKAAGLAAPARRGWSEERRAAFKAQRTGYQHTAESIEKMRQSKLGTKHTEETKAKFSEQRKGKQNGAAHGRYRDDVTADAIRALQSEGKTQEEIATTLKTSRAVIRRRLRESPA